MKQNFKSVDRLLLFAKNHPQFRIAVIIVTAVILYVGHLCYAIKNNARRIAITSSAFLITATLAVILICVPKASAAEESVLYENTIENAAVYSSGMTSYDEEIRELDSDPASEIISAEDDLTMYVFLEEGEEPAGYEDIQSYLLNNAAWTLTNKQADAADENETGIGASSENVFASDFEIVGEGIESDDLIDKDDWRLILVNKQYSIPDGYEPKLVNISGSMMVDERITEDLAYMFEAARADGIELMICSAYRSMERQQTLFDNKISKCLAKGLSYIDAYAEASRSVTIPGMSEHQLGLALDIVTGSYMNLDSGFGETQAGIWLKNHAPEYGFILRYPEDKEDITGIIYEPWHFRYVGRDYSQRITELGLTLEEFRSLYMK